MTVHDRASNSGPDLFGLSLHMMCTLSLEGLICLANESFAGLLGYLPAQLKNRLLGDFVNREQADRILDVMKGLEEGAMSETLSVELSCVDGRSVPCRLRMQRYECKIYASFAPVVKETEYIEQPIDSYQLISKILAKDTRDSNQFYRYVLRELMALYGYGRGCLRVYEGD